MKEITRRLWVIAHRGGAALAAENTMAAFRTSTEASADMLELDVRLTADNHLVIYHDQVITRTAGISRRVIDCSLRELQLLDVGSYFNEGLAGERISTLPEVLDWARGRARLLLDLKLEPHHEVQVIKEIVTRRMEFDVVGGVWCAHFLNRDSDTGAPTELPILARACGHVPDKHVSRTRSSG